MSVHDLLHVEQRKELRNRLAGDQMQDDVIGRAAPFRFAHEVKS